MLIITRKRNATTFIDNNPLTVTRYNPDQIEVTYKDKTHVFTRNKDAKLDADIIIGYFGTDKFHQARIGFDAPDDVSIVRDDAKVRVRAENDAKQ